jgi:hypothetical protein
MEPTTDAITLTIEATNTSLKAAKPPVSTPNGKPKNNASQSNSVKKPERHIHTPEKEQFCELCIARKRQLKEKEELERQEKQREQQIAAQQLAQAKLAQKAEDLKQLEERRKRKECDEFNKSQSKPTLITSIPGAEKRTQDDIDAYGSVLYPA